MHLHRKTTVLDSKNSITTLACLGARDRRLWRGCQRRPGVLRRVGVVCHGGVDEVLGSLNILRGTLPKGLQHGSILVDQGHENGCQTVALEVKQTLGECCSRSLWGNIE